MAWRITPHERDIVDRLANGYSSDDIAIDLGLTKSAVSKRLGYIYDQLGIADGPGPASRAEARRRHELVRQYLKGEVFYE